jgi:hypothetical protein
MNTNKSIFVSQHLIAIELGDIFSESKKEMLLKTKGNLAYLPTPATLYEKDIVENYNSGYSLGSQTNSLGKLNTEFPTGNLFKTSRRSRFVSSTDPSVLLDNTQDTSIEVPHFICNILNSKLSRYSQFKTSSDDSFINYYENNLKRIEHPWADFISSLGRNETNYFIDIAKFNSA